MLLVCALVPLIVASAEPSQQRHGQMMAVQAAFSRFSQQGVGGLIDRQDLPNFLQILIASMDPGTLPEKERIERNTKLTLKMVENLPPDQNQFSVADVLRAAQKLISQDEARASETQASEAEPRLGAPCTLKAARRTRTGLDADAYPLNACSLPQAPGSCRFFEAGSSGTVSRCHCLTPRDGCATSRRRLKFSGKSILTASHLCTLSWHARIGSTASNPYCDTVGHGLHKRIVDRTLRRLYGDRNMTSSTMYRCNSIHNREPQHQFTMHQSCKSVAAECVQSFESRITISGLL